MKTLSIAVLTVTLAVPTAGCDNSRLTRDARSGNLQVPTSESTVAPAASPFTPTQQPHLTDYSRLLLRAGDLSDADDTFAARSSTATPTDIPGASMLFVNAPDTRAISVTVAVYPSAATATATLREAVATANKAVTGGLPQPLPVGTDGTVIKGTSPDGGMDVTLVLFTHGPALARLEFNSATGDAATDQFVTNIAKMQYVALRVGLPDVPE